MNLLKICLSDNFEVDYDRSRGMYRVSICKNGYSQEEFWFDAYGDTEIPSKEIPIPVKRLLGEENDYSESWWHGYCPSCGKLLSYNFGNGCEKGLRKHYCFNCGQLCDFDEIVSAHS